MLLRNIVNREELKRRMDADFRPYTTISFYCYYPIEDPIAFRNDLFLRLSRLEVVGRIYIAREGINAQIALPSVHFESFKADLYTIDFLNNIRLNVAIEEKQKSFIKLDIKVREKIVADGISDPTFSLQNRGKYLAAAEWNQKMESPNAVVIDMRNHYESEVGRFEGASCPDTDTFREELARVLDLYKEEKDKPILMYCTGGIRCEKASAWMKHNGYNEVYHLEGGIINYVNQVKSAGLENKFKGVNFVFDQRLAERVSDDVIASCHQCGAPADTHINCANTGCHLLFIQCAVCAEKYEHCCSEACRSVTHLSLEEQIQLRKGKPAGRIFSKGRFPGKV
ncbi:MAG: rhodanese-related sulfurtransferase [Sphingomonadales bacterium]|nr:rhodanese-related sulfurtransferase [Sphingomonadales bacterium]